MRPLHRQSHTCESRKLPREGNPCSPPKIATQFISTCLRCALTERLELIADRSMARLSEFSLAPNLQTIQGVSICSESLVDEENAFFSQYTTSACFRASYNEVKAYALTVEFSGKAASGFWSLPNRGMTGEEEPAVTSTPFASSQRVT